MTPKNTVLVIVILAVGIVSLIKMLMIVLHASERKLERWAKRRGFEVLTSDTEAYSDNPLLQGTSRYQELFRVKVRTVDGKIRTGFVRIGSVYDSWFSDYAEEFWDDAKPS